MQLVDGGRLPFERNWFATRVAEVKATLPETARERNERLEIELEAACKTMSAKWHEDEINTLYEMAEAYTLEQIAFRLKKRGYCRTQASDLS
ncbi:hypothetical protein NIES4103_29840 [Nostoc sp. NIES-4103]|nr:hypothetical protein NIES4103_29840 [Nostoc sp. NIES-4103]